MNTKLLLSAVALGTGIALLAFVDWQSNATDSSLEKTDSSFSASSASARIQIQGGGGVEGLLRTDSSPIRHQRNHPAESADSLRARLEAADGFEMASLLADMEQLPDSPVKDELVRSTLLKWAKLDGAAAADWAKQRPQGRPFLPEILQTWAGTGTGAAAEAWGFAKRAFETDPDEATWRSPAFLTAAFRGMTAAPGEGVWTELASLSGTAAVHAMMGMADFASNAQTNTGFASEMERRVLDLGSPASAGAFYAAAGHIEAAKSELPAVTDEAQWHVIVREIARQQAVFEPSNAIEWLASQFSQPADGITDMVQSIGLMHTLNAGDVLSWLRNCPEGEARSAGIEQIFQRFPVLRTEFVSEVINPGAP